MPARAAQPCRAGPPAEKRIKSESRARARSAASRAPACRPRATRTSTEAATAAMEHRASAEQPAGAGVASRAERVHERERPRAVREPVRRPPGPVADARAQQAGEDDCEQKVAGERAEAEPDRPVGGDERHDGVLGGRSARSRRRPSSRRGRRGRRPRAATRCGAGLRPRNAAMRSLRQRTVVEHAEADRDGEQQQRDDARAARQVPERARPGGEEPLTPLPPRRPASRRRGRRRRRRRRGAPGAGVPRARPAAASPSTIAAVLAAFASTHERGGDATPSATASAAGRPVRGVDDVVKLAAPPRASGARRCRRSRGPPTGIDDRLTRRVERRGVVVGDPYGQPPGGAARRPRRRRRG